MVRTLKWYAAALALGTLVGCTNDAGPDLYTRTDLVSDQTGFAVHADTNLVNAWGLAAGPDTFFWVANEGTSTSTIYDGEGTNQGGPLGGAVALPSIIEGDEHEGPTGLVFNGTAGFAVQKGGIAAPSRFIFATTAGRIMGWSPEVDLHNAIVAVDESEGETVFTGLAIATTGSRTLLYAANFPGARVEVFDETFAPVTGLPQGAFVDAQLPAGYAPFGIQEIGGRIYVAYAKQDEAGDEEVTGSGLGYVDAYATDGTFVARIASAGPLDAPWGMAMAPDDFGQFGGALLVGNFGDGRITAIDVANRRVLGQLRSGVEEPVEIEGLWALMFGNGRMAGEADELYFTAGPDEETHGVFGEIAANGPGQ